MCYVTRMAWSARTALSRLMIVALLVPLALSALMPAFARIVSGPAPHVCRCELRGGHSTCACPICNPDRDEELALGAASIRGRCGDDDVAFGGALGLAVLGAEPSLPSADVAFLPLSVPRTRPPDVIIPPATPPPRRARV
jgi:hypothetical protein